MVLFVYKNNKGEIDMNNNSEKGKKPVYKKWWFWIIIIIVIIAIATSQGVNTDNTQQTSSNPNMLDAVHNTKITLEEFNNIETGMTYEQVVEIIGGEGTVLSETDITGNEQYKTTIYKWDGEGSLGANANVTFQGGKVVAKAQIGLK